MIDPETTLEIRRTFNASRADVFAAWTDPAQFNLWFGPSDEAVIILHEFDVRPGGNYRVDMQFPDVVYKLKGTYQEVLEPQRLVFTWGLADDDCGADPSLVSVELFEKGSSTEMVLNHTRLPGGPENVQMHYQGWGGAIARLEAYLGKSQEEEGE